MLMLGVAISGNAQSGVTYNHDSSKKNQITMMEIGSGSLSPELYYQLLHSSYKKSAASKNKLGFRTTAGIGAYNQVEYAEAIDSALTKRAEIEALNMADRQVDLAWKVEGSKINTTNIVSFIYCGLCFGWARKNAIYFGIICKFVEGSSLTVKGNSEIIFEKFEEGDWRYRIFKK